jgi:prophage DNA circulation protein
MSWLHTLLPASFRGAAAEVRSVKDMGENALAEHNYPYRNGGDVENFGRDAHKVPVEFILWGDDYEPKLKALVTAFEALDAGELVHPVFGSMQCHAKNWEVSHTAEEYNYCTVSVTFVEANADMPFFNRSLPNALGGLAGLQCLQALDALLTQYEGYMDMAMAYLGAGSSALSLLRGYWDRLMDPLFDLKSGITRLGGDVFAFPRGALSDVMALFGALHGSDKGKFIITPAVENKQTVAGTGVVMRPSASGFTPLYTRAEVVRDTLTVQKNVQNVLSAAIETSVVGVDAVANVVTVNTVGSTSAAQVKAVFNASIRAAEVVGAAAEIASVFEWELIDPTLSPKQVENALNQVRRPLQDAVVELRVAYDNGAGVMLGQELQDLAWQLTAAARAVIHQRPALLPHVIEADTNLHLLAHKLYGNYARAYEIARLNAVKNPNIIVRGEVLNVYSR